MIEAYALVIVRCLSKSRVVNRIRMTNSRNSQQKRKPLPLTPNMATDSITKELVNRCGLRVRYADEYQVNKVDGTERIYIQSIKGGKSIMSKRLR